MLDRYTARALMNLGRLSPDEYLRLYRDELLAQREKARKESRNSAHQREETAPNSPHVKPSGGGQH